LLEVKRWVLSYGAACRVLEPPPLRREVVEEIQQMETAYRNKTDAPMANRTGPPSTNHERT
jgi:hypothetical protein